jgi:hypothetical protein
MTFAISPRHSFEDFEGPWTLGQKIELFYERVKGWQIGPAIEMGRLQVFGRGFAQLALVMSYFEMIAKYANGFLGDGSSAYHFKIGLRRTFPQISDKETKLMDAFYSKVRSGLYHDGMVQIPVVLYDEIPGSFGYNEDKDLLVFSPDKFVEDVSIKFEEFTSELRNPENVDLRSNFEKRFDHVSK